MEKKERFYLDCPFSDKDEAKSLGAFWDADVRKWYVPDNLERTLFEKWFPGANTAYEEPKIVEDSDKFFLDVDFSDKDKVKKLGARWDPRARKWWTLEKDKGKFSDWWPKSSLRLVEDDSPPF